MYLMPQNCTLFFFFFFIFLIYFFFFFENYKVFKNIFIYFGLGWVFIAACGLSLVVVRGGYSTAESGLLIVVASIIAEHGL